MAKDVITRFRLETTGFDSKIKEAAKNLSAYSKTATQAKEGFNQFTKANVDAAKALGTMATSTTNAKDRAKELVGAFNDAAKAYNSLTKEQQQSDWAKALAGSLTQLQQRIKDTKAEIQGLDGSMKGSGGLFSGIGSKMEGALAVFGGNLMTKAAGAVASLGSEMVGLVQQGVELAKQGEGIRNAFERLGRGDILDGLRQATHGTVTDIELMKAAVKFNDFKLPLDELGTMLAFAQQKAKDTGQSVDYMVDSIVTGLGRKSLMILDNLGLSATEVKDKMKETGDMTKAVGAIIREQMAKAGDYVETAADRAAQANVSLQNKMEELGRKFAPVEEASNQLWTSMKIGILDIVGGPLARLLNGLTEAGRLKNMLNDLNGGGNGKESQTEKALRMLREYSGGGRGIEGKRDLYNRQMASYSSQEEKAWREANRLREELKGLRSQQKENGLAGNIQPLISETTRQLEAAENRAKAIQIMRANYQKGAVGILNPAATNTPTITTSGGTTGGTKGGTTKTPQTELQQNQTKINELTQQYVTLMAAASKAGKPLTDEQQKQTAEIQRQISELEKRNGLLGLYQEQAQGRLMGVDVMTGGLSMTGGFTGLATPQSMSDVVRQRGGSLLDDKAMKAVNEDIGRNLPKAKEKDSPLESGKKLLNGISQLTDGLEKIGIDIPDEIQSVIGVIQGVMQVIEAVNTIIGVTQTSALAANTAAIISLEAALWANTSTSWLPFANGGVVHAAGGIVAGNTFSGDQIPAMLNAGEVVLNRAQAGNLASQLEGGAFQNLKLDAVISGEQIRLVLNNNGRRTGRGEYVQSTRRR